jgi:excisionase family DNA binding protein
LVLQYDFDQLVERVVLLEHYLYALMKEHQSMIETQQQRDLLTTDEVAKYLRVDVTTVRRWIKEGAMDAVALPHTGKRRAYRVKKATLDRLLGKVLPL